MKNQVIKFSVLVFILLLNACNTEKSNTKKEDNSSIKESSSLVSPQIQVIPIQDSKTDRNYELYIELPEDYSESDNKKYPVLYYTDAAWHREVLSAGQEYILEDVILVGISWQTDINENLKNEVGAHVSRFRDYSISKHNDPEIQKKYQLGQANNHLDFIRNDVIKYVDDTYRTNTNSRTYFGYSLSGEFGTYILLTQPDTFDNYIIGSPSISTDLPALEELNSQFGAFNESDRSTSMNANVFISYGSMEEKEVVEPIEAFIKLLNDSSDDGLLVKKEVIEGNHASAFPMTGVRSMLWLSQLDNFQVQSDLYFGQKPPGLIPEVFAPDVVSINGRFESTISFSPDLKELYFDAKYEDEASQIYFSKLVNGTWTPIKKANLTKGNKRDEMHPFASHDGKRIYFMASDSIFLDERIWYVNRLEDSWSDAIKLDSPVNDDMVFFPNQSKNGGLYYFSLSKFKTYYTPEINGEFIEPREVEIEMGHHAYTSLNDDYLLVTARSNEEENRKDNDIYAYFRNQDGTWSNPINLGTTVNSNFSEKTPSISPDGKYLFFGRDERDIEPGLANIFWVSTEVIERLRPQQQGQ